MSDCDIKNKEFKECSMLTSTDDCTHQQDTIIECEGEGDNTGKS